MQEVAGETRKNSEQDHKIDSLPENEGDSEINTNDPVNSCVGQACYNLWTQVGAALRHVSVRVAILCNKNVGSQIDGFQTGSPAAVPKMVTAIVWTGFVDAISLLLSRCQSVI